MLCSVANKTVYQLFNRTIDFKDRYDAYIQQTDMMVVKFVVDVYGVFPNYGNQATFDIINGQPIIPDLQVPKDASFDVYGAKRSPIIPSTKELATSFYKILSDIHNKNRKFILLESYINFIDLQEEFKAFGNIVAAGYAGYEYGNVTIYRKETSFTAQVWFMCFVKDRTGKLYGSNEILQEDFKVRKDLITRIDNFLKTYNYWWNHS